MNTPASSPGDSPTTSRVSWWIPLVAPLLLACLRLFGLSWRADHRGNLPRGGHILCLWHKDLLPWILPLSGQGRAVMVSLSRDGSLLTEVLGRIGFYVVRGSSSKRGADALKELEMELRQGRDIILAVDGPRGPAGVAHTGAARLALLTGAPVVCLGLAAPGSWRLKTWDRLIIPRPFSRVVYAVGNPFLPPSGDISQGTRAIKVALDTCGDHAAAQGKNSLTLRESLLFWLADAATTLLCLVVSPLVVVGFLHPGFRQELKSRIRVPRHLPPDLIWIHAASLGEAQLATRLVQNLQIGAILTTTRALPDSGPWASTFKGVWVLPLDLPWVIRRFLRAVRPRALWMVEGEIWPALLREIRRAGIPLNWLNARISATSAGFLLGLGPWLRPCLRQVHLFCPYTAEDGTHFHTLGLRAQHDLAPCDLKVLPAPRVSPIPTPLLTWLEGRVVWIAACTHPGEEAVVLEAHLQLRSRHPGLVLILAPRKPSRTDEIIRIVEGLDLSARRLTQLRPGGEVLVVDTLGELAGILPVAEVAFLGGTLVPVGGHNPWELACAQIPFVTGAYTHAIEEALQQLPSHWLGIVTGSVDMAERLDETWDVPRPPPPSLPSHLTHVLGLLREQISGVNRVE